MNNHCQTKVVIIGAGKVGCSAAYAAMIKGVCTELVLVDADEKREEGEIMDLVHGLQFVETSRIYGGDYKDCKDADVIVITAGASQKPGDTRLDLADRNIAILKSIVSKIKSHLSKHTIVLLVSNPVDVLTYVAQKLLPKHPPCQIIGSGTGLDTSRLRYYLGEYFGVNPRSVHAYILGEHGDSEFCAWSNATIAGKPLKSFKQYNQKKLDIILNQTKNAAYEIIKRKGSTYYAIGLVIAELLEIILHDQMSVMPLSVNLNGLYGIKGVCLGLPCVLDRNGVREIIDTPLNSVELKQLKKSAEQLRGIILNFGF